MITKSPSNSITGPKSEKKKYISFLQQQNNSSQATNYQSSFRCWEVLRGRGLVLAAHTQIKQRRQPESLSGRKFDIVLSGPRLKSNDEYQHRGSIRRLRSH